MALSVILVGAFLFPAVASAAAPNPIPGKAIVDGKYKEWNLENDFFANMYRAGDSTKTLEAISYVRYDCDTNTVYVLVLRNPQINDPILVAGNETFSWTKIDPPGSPEYDGNTGNNGIPPDFAWVGLSPDGKTAQGYEASFILGPGTYRIVIHTEVLGDNAMQTAATIGFPRTGTAFILPADCDVPPVFIPTPEFPTLALPAGLILGLIGAVFFLKSTRET